MIWESHWNSMFRAPVHCFFFSPVSAFNTWFELSMLQFICMILLVFSVTPFKIDQSKNQNRSIDKVQNLEMKGSIYTKTFAKNQVRGLFRIRDIRRNVLPKLIEICMETPCWCSPGWAPTWRTETNRNICYRVLLQKREFILRETHKH